jgi:ribosomal protein L20
MPRSVNKVASKARKKKVLQLAKGSFGRRKNVWSVAKNSVEKGLGYAYRDRKTKKRNFRALWIQRINAAARMHDCTPKLIPPVSEIAQFPPPVRVGGHGRLQRPW